jgi:hypothetical protein
MNHAQRIDILGRMGEKIVVNYLNNLGHKVEESIDPYDRVKDMTVNNQLNIEVKTEQPFVIKNAFTIRENQLKKCRNVDELYFVSVPPLMNLKYKWGGWIFKVDPKTFVESSRYTTKYGNKMVVIPINQDAVVPVQKLKQEEITELLKYTESSYRK